MTRRATQHPDRGCALARLWSLVSMVHKYWFVAKLSAGPSTWTQIVTESPRSLNEISVSRVFGLLPSMLAQLSELTGRPRLAAGRLAARGRLDQPASGSVARRRAGRRAEPYPASATVRFAPPAWAPARLRVGHWHWQTAATDAARHRDCCDHAGVHLEPWVMLYSLYGCYIA